MHILPVLDLMNGVVVRGVGGRRHEYRPIVSALTASAKPVDVARAFRACFGLSELYLADLDAIAGNQPAVSIYRDLSADGFRLWVDSGIGPEGAHLDMLQAASVASLIAGLESLSGPEELSSLVARFSAARVVFSLDLHNGNPLGTAVWSGRDPWPIAEQAIALGVERLLVLDLASVGSRQGIATKALCERLRTAFPKLEITTGGGVRGADDLQRLRRIGVDNVLVASALHDGQLKRADLERQG
jgi:phosphoribosylformimino-5-aminoimidazole carboxamide ribotide isomerase